MLGSPDQERNRCDVIEQSGEDRPDRSAPDDRDMHGVILTLAVYSTTANLGVVRGDARRPVSGTDGSRSVTIPAEASPASIDERPVARLAGP